jgi:hypothetical protein
MIDYIFIIYSCQKNIKKALLLYNNYEYFQKAIEYIHSIEKNTHFYIVSDDIEYCKTCPVLDNIKKTLDTLYFMSNCVKRGICSNSSFSGWGNFIEYK